MPFGPRRLRDINRDLVTMTPDFLNLGPVTLRIEGKADLVLPRFTVLQEPKTIREMTPTGGNVQKHGTMFVWLKSLSVQPPLGSLIIDQDGEYFVVYKVENKPHVECWEPVCLRLNITGAPWNRALLLTATYTHGEAGEAQAQWVGFYSGQEPPTKEDTIRCRFQPMSEDAELVFGAEYTRETYTVFFERHVPRALADGDIRIVDENGNRYRVTKYYNEMRFDTLPCCLVTRIVEGSEYHDAGRPPQLSE